MSGAAANPVPRSIRFDEAFLRKLDALAVVARRSAGGDVRAERRSRRVGTGIEFADHREYAPGDDVRTLDWNLFARLDRPYVRLREEEENLNLSILIDNSASMSSGSPPKLELAVRVGAALATIALGNLDRVSVSLVGTRVNAALSALRGRGAAADILTFLAGAAAGGPTDLGAALQDAQRAARGSGRRGLTILISDLLDAAGYARVVDRLRATRPESVLIQITADDDATVPFDGDLLLQDAETGETRAVTITPVTRRAHADRHDALLRGVLGACRARGIRCFQIPSGVPFEDAVLRILRVGGILG